MAAAPVNFYRFWQEFYNHNAAHASDRSDFYTFFHTLLQTPAIPQPAEWRVISVFQCRQEPSAPTDGGAGVGALRVSYSGEAHYNTPLTDYDVNLIMCATDTSSTARTVCLPLFIVASHVHDYWPRYRVPRTLIPAEKTYFCAFVISNGGCIVRNRFAARLNAYKPIHSCGGAMNNCGFSAPREKAAYFSFLSLFKFTICFENRALPEYLTEKLHNAWLGGTIPIYWGASRAQEWLNPRAFLQLPDAATEDDMDALIARIAELDRDPVAYAAMFAEPLLLPEAPLPRECQLDAIRADIAATISARTPPHTAAPEN